MTKYIKVEWPDSQLFQVEEYENECYQCDNMTVFVPEDLYYRVMVMIPHQICNKE